MAAKRDTLDPTVRRMVDLFGLFPFPAAAHIAEYVSWGYETCGMLWPQGDEGHVVGGDWMNYRKWMAFEADRVRRVAAGEEPLTDEMTQPSGEIAVPIICDIELDRGERRDAVNVLNTGGYVANLPRGAAVEVPAVVDARGIRPLEVGPVPEAFAAWMRTQFTIHDLVTEAWRTRSRKLLLQALLLDPCTSGIVESEKMLDEMLELQADFLPTFE